MPRQGGRLSSMLWPCVLVVLQQRVMLGCHRTRQSPEPILDAPYLHTQVYETRRMHGEVATEYMWLRP